MRIEDMQRIAAEIGEFEEELLIDRGISFGGRQWYLLAACRKGKTILVYLLAEHPEKKEEDIRRKKIWKKRSQGKMTKREELLGLIQHPENLTAEIEGIKTPQGEFNVSSVRGGGFEAYDAEGFVLLSHFLERGISAAAVKETDLSDMDYMEMELEGEFEKIPFSAEDMTLLYHPKGRVVPVKKKMKLEIGKQYPRKYRFYCEELERNVEFYINEVSLYDSWTEIQKTRKQMDSLDMEEGQKADISRQLEEICPKGMYHLVIEYECEEGILEFYTKDQLQKTVETRASATSIILAGHKNKGPEYGPHGFKRRSCMIQYPVAGDVTAIETELLTARIPGKEDKVSLFL